MNQDKYVFAQLTSFMNRTLFNNHVRKYNGNNYVKHFIYWNHLLDMMFGQLSNRENLRNLIVAFETYRGKQYHLGLGHKLIATTFAYANQNRDCRIFEDFTFYMMKEACKKRMTNILNISGKKYAFDSRKFRFVCRNSLGPSSVVKKVVLRLMSYMTLTHKSHLSTRL